ncbi:phage tail sheath subtilisin-like domain-containing protein [Novosphingobium humi]|uniref:phage tail sheath subtilisin-like domain-containing protein n=1 Tax=Novosphingobium humi TaxID=2282397 RepID=UPI0025B1E126|nr:phage tail sheath subtilisin-like domain-containing protein [Novosphingobium humi]WJS97850.1 phage tail sheath subtilisin-like domain-containing protein [Novosphingobium humi]
MHGIKTTLKTSTSLTPATVATSVIGMVVTAPDADATLFPLDTPVLVSNVLTALAKAGTSGTLRPALLAIADIVSPRVIVVRVGVDAQNQDALVLGTQSGPAYTGVQALLMAEAKTGSRPRILGAPGLDSEAVTNGLVAVAKRLRGFVYAMAQGETRDEAIAYREGFGARELMLFWPATSGGKADTIGRALGLRAYIDQTVGWHKTISNVVITGVTGIGADVSWAMDDDTTDAALLNEAGITTLICYNGYRFWGNETTSDVDSWKFESAVRTSQVLQDTIQEAHFPYIDSPLTVGMVKALIAKGNAFIRKCVTNGQMIGGNFYYDTSLNETGDLAGGNLVLSYDFTPCAPLQSLTEVQTITDTYYADFAAQLANSTTAVAA